MQNKIKELEKKIEELELKLVAVGDIAIANWDDAVIEGVDTLIPPETATVKYRDMIRVLFVDNPELIKKLKQENAELRVALNTALAIEFLDDKNIVELIKRLITIKEENDLQRSN